MPASVNNSPRGPVHTVGIARAALAVVAIVAIGAIGALTACGTGESGGEKLPLPAIEWNPRSYVCYRAPAPPTIDGRLEDDVWAAVPWTEDFVDIRGPGHPAPRFRTRVRLLWDDDWLYIGARLEEPDVWGTLTRRDSVIFHDNDFELFIDPDGDTHDYYELELNALGTEWDLLLRAPYRDAESPAVDAWDIVGLRTGIQVDGTLNTPGDVDSGWSVEIAIPWTALAEYTTRPAPPRSGDLWWMNFSRVEWQVDASADGYVKRVDPATGQPFHEDNWVWSQQGLVAMHYPEMWGQVQFSSVVAGVGVGAGETAFVPDPAGAARWALRKLYYAQRHFEAVHGEWATDLADLDLATFGEVDTAPFDWPPRFTAGATGWEAVTTDAAGNVLTIRHDGRLEVETLEARP